MMCCRCGSCDVRTSPIKKSVQVIVVM